MRAVAQTAQNAVRLLGQFCDAYGMEVIEAAYGWKQKPVQRKGRFWAYYDTVAPTAGTVAPTADAQRGAQGDALRDDKTAEALVGWGAMSFDTRDAADDEALISVGVFPAYQRRGYRHRIYDHMIAVATKLGADCASLIVLKSNEEQYNRTMREAHMPGSKWVYAGDTWYPPPGYGYFVRPLTDERRVKEE